MYYFIKTLCMLLYFINFNESFAEDVTVAINTRRSLHRVDEKYISIVIDPIIIMSGLNISAQTFSLARHLSPAFIRIYGPSTTKLSFVQTEPVAGSEDTQFTVSPSQWTALNEWIISANLTAVYALSDRDRVNEAWNPKPTALPLMELTDKMNISCYWELTNETPNKTLKQYVDDVTALHHILDAFPGSRRSWATAGGDLSRCEAADTPDLTRKLLLDVENNVAAVNWAPKFVKMANFPPKRTKVFRSKYLPQIWTTAPRSSKPASFGDGLLWAKNLGEAASTGYSVIFRQPKVKELFETTPAYWVSLLHKNLMGRTVLDMRQYSEKSNSFIYAHCAKKQNRFSRRGAVTILVVNMGTEELNTFVKFNGIQLKNLEIQSYILTTADENSSDAYLNGQLLKSSDLHDGKTDFIPKIRRTRAKRFLALNLPGKSVGFYVLPGIRLPVCIHGEEELHLIREEILEDQNGKYWSTSDSAESGAESAMSDSGAMGDVYRLMEDEFDTNEEYYTNAELVKKARARKGPSMVQTGTEPEQKTSTDDSNRPKNELLDGKLHEDVRQLIIDRAKLLEKQRQALAMEQRRSDLKQLLLERSKIEKGKSERRDAFKYGLEFPSTEIQQILREQSNEKSTQQENFSQGEINYENDYLANQEKNNMNKLKRRKSFTADLAKKLSTYNNDRIESTYREKRESVSSKELPRQVTLMDPKTGNKNNAEGMNVGVIENKDSLISSVKRSRIPFKDFVSFYSNSLEQNTSYPIVRMAYENLIHSKPRKSAMVDTASNEIQSIENILESIPHYQNKEQPDGLAEDKTWFKEYKKLSTIKSKQRNKYKTTQNKSKGDEDKQKLKETEEKRTNKNIDIETTSRQNELSKNRTKRNLSDKLMEIRQGRENIRERLKSGYMINRQNKRRGKNTTQRMKKHVRRTKRETRLEINGTPNETYDVNDYDNDYNKYTHENSMVNGVSQYSDAQNVNAIHELSTNENNSKQPSANANTVTQIMDSVPYSTETTLGKPLKERGTVKTKKSKAQIKILQRKLEKQRKMEERLQNYLKKVKENTHEISNEIQEYSGFNVKDNELDNAIYKRFKRNAKQIYLSNNMLQSQYDIDNEQRLQEQLGKNLNFYKIDAENSISDDISLTDKTKETEIHANEISKESQIFSDYFNKLENAENYISQEAKMSLPKEDEYFLIDSTTEFYSYSNDIPKDGRRLPNYLKDMEDDVYKIMIPSPITISDENLLSKNKHFTSTAASDLGSRILFPIREQDFDSPEGTFSKKEVEDSLSDETVYQVQTQAPETNLVDNVFQVVFHFLSDFHKRILNFIGYDRQ